ncbi:multifunctional oxoglutarate decarboxylase/oxoglutarate dehydrogenase thiamine pyrophosphate-binding subunit/dihydrolipoyllysine-residue succinyltransferase subunit [Streptomyces sp. NPDC054842]
MSTGDTGHTCGRRHGPRPAARRSRRGKKAFCAVTSQPDTGRAVPTADFGPNAWVVDEQWHRYRHDPRSVDPTWRDFFAAHAFPAPPAGGPAGAVIPAQRGGGDVAMLTAVRVAELIAAYRTRGHLAAATDPLATGPAAARRELDLAVYRLDGADPAGKVVVDGFAGHTTMALQDVVITLREFYCGTVGFEYMHLTDARERRWIQQRVEGPQHRADRAEKLQVLYRLGAADSFEAFLQKKYVGHKRYSLEGGESAIVLLDALLLRAIDAGTADAVIGMAHRGRLNVLANIVGKSCAEIFDEFLDTADVPGLRGSGDVKYHLGAEGTYRALTGGSIGVSVVANPSHLEIVGPVVQGVVRARQEPAEEGGDPRSVLPVVVHGDAAFAGQGVVAETFNMSRLPGYRTGGTVHVVVNNQLGFTTPPAGGRSGTYATDVAHAVGAPVLHVNGDDPEAVVRVARLAFDYRQTFHKDVVVDLVCYRRHGHSEVDDPSVTQPRMYDRIGARPSVRALYADSLIRRGELTVAQVEGARRNYQEHLERAFAETRTTPAAPRSAEGPRRPDAELRARRPVATSIDEPTARRVIATQTDLPPDLTVHPRVLPQLTRRAAMLDDGTIDWATAETLAIGSLLLDGVPVRLTGQDSRRGTFGQRHAVLTDRHSGAEYTPLNHLGPRAARFSLHDSMLSELAALAFEYGYALARPEALVLWEAQFGDFSNGAQTVIDEFIASSDQKWGLRSALTLLLPHGLEGQGPDHSSARIERFLQLCAQDNMTVALPSTPGNYFHLLRRHASDAGGTPLVIFTPKSMLRSKAATSALNEFTRGEFRPVLPDLAADPARVTRVLLCSGKVYYDLDARRRSSGSADTAIVRLERLYPFPERELAAEIARFPGAVDVRWVQEEPENQGPWSFVEPRLRPLVSGPVECVSRPASAAPAVGSARRHAQEQEALVTSAFR